MTEPAGEIVFRPGEGPTEQFTVEVGAVEVPDAPQTGDPGVDGAVAALRAAVAGPLEDQVVAYDAVHRALQDRLADVEG